MEDVHNAGGVPAIINELIRMGGVLHPDRMTVTGKTLREMLLIMKSLMTKLSGSSMLIPIQSKVACPFYMAT